MQRWTGYSNWVALFDAPNVKIRTAAVLGSIVSAAG